jgi:hypothetical protein
MGTRRVRPTILRMMALVAAWGPACAGLVSLGRSGEVKLATLLALLFIALNIGLAAVALTGQLERRGRRAGAAGGREGGRRAARFLLMVTATACKGRAGAGTIADGRTHPGRTRRNRPLTRPILTPLARGRGRGARSGATIPRRGSPDDSRHFFSVS